MSDILSWRRGAPPSSDVLTASLPAVVAAGHKAHITNTAPIAAQDGLVASPASPTSPSFILSNQESDTLVGGVRGHLPSSHAVPPIRPSKDLAGHTLAHGSPSMGKAGSGPAAPLHPLTIDSSIQPLPHPSTYAGSDNWALTPNDGLPSLPATPSKALHALGWQRQGTPVSDHSHTTPGKEPNTARALLQRRFEDGAGLSGSLGNRNMSPSPRAVQRASPKMGHAGLGLGAPTSSPSARTMPAASPTSATAGTAATSIAAILSSGHDPREAPALNRQDSATSLASSSQLGGHALSFSRRASHIRNQSPAQASLSAVSTTSSVRSAMPGYQVYRPPHMRTDSTYALKPKMAHYDRVSAPLRGQSRSPDTSQLGAISRVPSSAVSRTSKTPSEAHSPSPRTGKRRVSRLGSFQATAAQAPDTSHGFDTNSLIAKLASAKLDMGSRTSNSPRWGDRSEPSDVSESAVAPDDIDLNAEDVMMMSSSTLTDDFYRSRAGSVSENGPVVDIFEVGDRLGPGMMHDGHEITIAQTSEGFSEQAADWTGTQLEVVTKLGEGSYAVVYLVKEVRPFERGANDDEDTSKVRVAIDELSTEPSTLTNDTSFEADKTVLQNNNEDIYGTTLKATSSGRLAHRKESENSEPENQFFALKCLCKRDLSETMLEVQRLEATIHQSIPPHPNIVTLYRTYETPEWLFLILEYCPGQDLFYWLEQAQDTEKLGAATPGGTSSDSLDDTNEQDSTPPSPGLLASTTTRFLLSRRRLRLISRMFQQICEAVAVCHSRGIAHRDLKPENFIVEDTRTGSAETSTGIKVKLTDFGLAVAQKKCIDFDCGSKPYMSFECRNNTTHWYNPIESDVWSLGIVLLNLIFHRNPFTEPNAEHCPSFATYVQDPVYFLTTAFRGLKRQAAEFLAEHVFCDVTEEGEAGGGGRHRITAQELGKWASSLEEHLELQIDDVRLRSPAAPGESLSEAGADLDITMPLRHSRSQATSAMNSTFSSPASNVRSLNIHQELMSMGITEDEIASFTPLFGDSYGNGNAQASSHTQEESEGGVDVLRQSRGAADKNSDGHFSPSKRAVASGVSEGAQQEVQERVDQGAADSKVIELPDTVVDGDDNKQSFSPHAFEESEEADTADLMHTSKPKRKSRGARKPRAFDRNIFKRSRSVDNVVHTTQETGRRMSPDMGYDQRGHATSELSDASQDPERETKQRDRDKSIRSPIMSGSENVTFRERDRRWREPARAKANALAIEAPGGRPFHTAQFKRHNQLPYPLTETASRSAPSASSVHNWRERSSPQFVSTGSFNKIVPNAANPSGNQGTAGPPSGLTASRRHRAPAQASGVPSGVTPRAAPSVRNIFAPGSHLGTINERAVRGRLGAGPTVQENLDASDLGGVFGGQAGQSGASTTGNISRHTQAGTSSRRAPDYTNGHHDRSTGGIQGGVLNAALGRSTGVPPAESAESSLKSIGANYGGASVGPPPPSQPPSSLPLIGLPMHDDAHRGDSAGTAAAAATNPAGMAGEAPRRKMLGKFLQGVKNYNSRGKAAVAGGDGSHTSETTPRPSGV